MPMYWGDYFADTHHLSTLEHGAYVLLIAYYWQHERLPTDPEDLRKICKISRHLWKKISPKLAHFFEPGWRHRRVEKELEKAKVLSMKRQFYGAKGGLKSRGRANMERHIEAKQLLNQKGDQSQSHISKLYSFSARKGTSEEER